MIGWLKWLIAGRELETLNRYRVAVGCADRWLAEFPDSVDALGHVKAWAEGRDGEDWDNYADISRLRERMRRRREANRSPFAVAPDLPNTARALSLAELEELEWAWRADHGPYARPSAGRRSDAGAAPTADRDAATDWDVAERHAEETFRRHEAERRAFGGITAAEWQARADSAPDGAIDYRFLGVTGEES